MGRWGWFVAGVVVGFGLAAGLLFRGGTEPARDDRPGVVRGHCRVSYVSGVEGDPNPVTAWQPMPDLAVAAADPDGKAVASVKSGPDGSFRLEVRPGTYALFGDMKTYTVPPRRIDGRDAPDNRGLVVVRAGEATTVDFDVDIPRP